MKTSIQNRTIFFISLILSSAFVFLGLFNYQSSKNSIRNEIVHSSIPLLRDNIYSEINRNISPSLNISSVMGYDSFLINWVVNGEEDVPQLIQYLEKIKKEYAFFSTFFVSAYSKKYYFDSGVNKVISSEDPHDVWYFDFINSNKEYDIDVDSNETQNNQLTIFINNRVHDFDGNLIGVAGVGIKMTNFSVFLQNQEERYDRKIFLVDRSGTVQAHSDITVVETQNINHLPGINEIADKLLSDFVSPVIYSFEQDGRDILVSSKYIEDMDWFLIVEQDETEALKSAYSNLIRTFIVGFVVLVILLFLTINILNRHSKELIALVEKDPLTGASNRREFTRILDHLIAKKKRYSSPITLLIFDIDFFKEINDTWGHQEGDNILKDIVNRIKRQKRSTDILSRFGGDEFTILVELDKKEALSLAGRIQEDLEKNEYRNRRGQSIPVTLSIGVYEATFYDTEEDIINKADKALYRAKSCGRNCIKVYT